MAKNAEEKFERLERQLRVANQQLAANAQQLKAANQQLIASEELFRDFFANAPVGFHIFGPDRVIADINETELAMIGYTRDEVVGKKIWADLIIPAQRDRFEKHWQDIITKGHVRDLEYTLVHKDGHNINVVLNASSRFDEHSNLINTRGSVLDITKRKQAEDALKAINQQQLKAANQQLKAANQQLAADEQQLRAANQQLTASEQQLKSTNQQLKASEQQLKAANQQLKADEQQLRAANQQLTASEQQLNAANQQLKADEQQLRAAHQQLAADEQQLRAAHQQLTVDEQQLRAANQQLAASEQQLKATNKQLQESEKRYRLLFERSVAAVYRTTLDGEVLDCNGAFAELLGYDSPQDVVGLNASQFYFTIDDRKEFVARLQKQRVVTGLELCIRHKKGSPIWIQLEVILVEEKGHSAFILGTCVNITKRKEGEKKLLEYQSQLKSLASELSLAEERQRRRIAAELHDRISQSLVISKVELQSLRQSVDSVKIAKSLDKICDSLGQIIQDTRSLTFDLGSPILYELGFETAVAEWLVEQVQEKHGIATVFEDDNKSKPLNDDIRALLFRDVRELLINVVKHAKAKKVKVSIKKIDKFAQVIVEDDGVGFDASKLILMPNREGGFGIFSIRERLEHLGGKIIIDSKPGHGSKITLTAPLKQ